MCFAFSAIHLFHWWKKWNAVVVGIFPLECEQRVDADAYYLALIIAGVIDAHGPLPNDSQAATQIITDVAPKLGYSWQFNSDPLGRIYDCLGYPFQIDILPDRVSVTSQSLYAFYFAEYGKKPTPNKHGK